MQLRYNSEYYEILSSIRKDDKFARSMSRLVALDKSYFCYMLSKINIGFQRLFLASNNTVLFVKR